jgi:hypothetical protein
MSALVLAVIGTGAAIAGVAVYRIAKASIDEVTEYAAGYSCRSQDDPPTR